MILDDGDLSYGTQYEEGNEPLSLGSANEHEWGDRKWARCVLCGVYEDDYEPSDLPPCTDKARDDYSAAVASDYDEPWEY